MKGRKIRIAIVGVGNCASALVQGLAHYSKQGSASTGLMAELVGSYSLDDIEVVAAFDVDIRKVGSPLHEAIFSEPNCAMRCAHEVPPSKVIVRMGPILDGVAPHMAAHPEKRSFRPAPFPSVDVLEELKRSKVQVLVCYLPVGSEQAVRFYAEACLSAKIAMINCVPVFLASDPTYSDRFREARIPIVGDDIKSQVGATIVHRVLANLLERRGYTLDRTYQLNVGGNADFLNMQADHRLESKRVSKTNSVQSAMNSPLSDDAIRIGPSDYVPWLFDRKVAFMRLEASGFAGAKLDMEIRLSVEDSPNSAAVVVDAIRCARVALDRGIGGPLEAVCAAYMKSPPTQMDDWSAFQAVDSFLAENN